MASLKITSTGRGARPEPVSVTSNHARGSSPTFTRAPADAAASTRKFGGNPGK